MEEIAGNIITATIPNFCRITGIGRSKTYELLDDDTLESIKIGKRRLIVLDSYRKLIERQRAARSTHTGEDQSPAPQPIDAAAPTGGPCGKTRVASRGDLNAPTEEIPAGTSPGDHKPDHPHRPSAGKGPHLDCVPYQTRNKTGGKSNARAETGRRRGRPLNGHHNLAAGDVLEPAID